jgi:glycosyltransferase involved in cell wall biosynthesis
MSLTVLSVAFPFVPVGRDSVGGSEQILTLLDDSLVRAGHRSIVVACQGSRPAGRLLSTTRRNGNIDDHTRAQVWCEYRRVIETAVRQNEPDLVHMHGLDFHEYMPSGPVPVLATLHLPPSWYPDHVFDFQEPHWFIQPVSQSQAKACPPDARMLPPIVNGIDLARLTVNFGKRDFVLVLGRICPEKALHLAMDAARMAGRTLLLGGQVFPYTSHVAYFEDEIRPRLNRRCRYVGPLGLRMKRRLMTQARCVLVPSLVAETSSLVAMEALACGTPVITFPSGALSEIVEHGRTGFLVNSPEEMADAIQCVDRLDPAVCRQTAW